MKEKIKTVIDILKAAGAIAALLLTCLNEYDKIQKKAEEEKKKICDDVDEVVNE